MRIYHFWMRNWSKIWKKKLSDDQFIIKTVQHKEAEFLQKLLPGYYMVSCLFLKDIVFAKFINLSYQPNFKPKIGEFFKTPKLLTSIQGLLNLGHLTDERALIFARFKEITVCFSYHLRVFNVLSFVG